MGLHIAKAILKNVTTSLLNTVLIICVKYVVKICNTKNLVIFMIPLNNLVDIKLNPYIILKK